MTTVNTIIVSVNRYGVFEKKHINRLCINSWHFPLGHDRAEKEKPNGNSLRM